MTDDEPQVSPDDPTGDSRWRAIIDAAVDGIVLIDSEGRIEAFNPGAERLFGYSEAEVLGKNITILMPSPYREEHVGYIANYIRTGIKKIIGIGREVEAMRRDGTIFPVHLSVGEALVNGERKFTGILHDLTGRKRMETQLAEQAALVRLGEMAAVIAHEVKNPLAGIRGAIQVIGTRLPPGSKEAQIVKEVVTRIDALNDLMKDMLLFARPPRPRPAPVEVRSLVEGTANLLQSDPTLAGVQVSIEGQGPTVLADVEMLRIVFLNLLMNAAQAMQGRGRISVRIDVENQVCRVTLTDAGPGMPPEVLDHIFTPFFTTKARGTGLGLATARRLIETHGGTIRIASQVGAGTTVTVELPQGNSVATTAEGWRES